MSYTEYEKNQFVLARVQGVSFAKISETLSISKPTLIKWSKELAQEIAELTLDRSEELLSKYELTPQMKFEDAVVQLDRVKKEIRSRDLNRVTFKTLLDMQIRLEKIIKTFEVKSWEAMQKTHNNEQPAPCVPEQLQ